MKGYIALTGGSENVSFFKIFSNIYVVFCSNLMSGDLRIVSNTCVLLVCQILTIHIIGE